MAEEKMSMLQKLGLIQRELKAPKNQYNDFGDYKYRSCEDILEAVKPLLEKYECILTLNDEIVLIGERYYIKAIATLQDSETSISNVAYAREQATVSKQVEAQITGSTSSYARKYALNGLFLIDDVKDPDATNNHGKEIKNEEVKNKTYKSWLDTYFAQYPEQLQPFLKKKKIERLDLIDKVMNITQIDKLISDCKSFMAKEQKTGIYSQEETF